MHDCNDGNVCVCMHTHTSCMDIIDMMTCMNDRMTVSILNLQIHSFRDHQDIHMFLQSHPTDYLYLYNGETVVPS